MNICDIPKLSTIFSRATPEQHLALTEYVGYLIDHLYMFIPRDSRTRDNPLLLIATDRELFGSSKKRLDYKDVANMIEKQDLVSTAFEVVSTLQREHGLPIKGGMHRVLFEISSRANTFHHWAELYSEPQYASFGSFRDLVLLLQQKHAYFSEHDTAADIVNFSVEKTLDTLFLRRLKQVLPILLKQDVQRMRGTWMDLMDNEKWDILRKVLSDISFSQEARQAMLQEITYVVYSIDSLKNKHDSDFFFSVDEHYHTFVSWFQTYSINDDLQPWIQHLDTVKNLGLVEFTRDHFYQTLSYFSSQTFPLIEESICTV